MPKPIQRPEQALALARAYNIKGKLPLVLDEVVVPVHIVGELDPAEWTPPAGPGPTPPAGSVSASIRVDFTTNPGAGNHRICILDFAPVLQATPNPVVVEYLQQNTGDGISNDWYAGIGIENVFAAPQAGDFRLQQVNLGNDPVNGVALTNMVVSQYHAPDAHLPSLPLARWRHDGVNRQHFGWVLGTVRSNPPWRTVTGPIARGNAEFWWAVTSGNQNVSATIRVTILPALT